MCALDRQGLLPLPRFVRVDIDRIRELLPEMREYTRRDARTAGQMTQKEAGLIAEVVSEEALARGLNVWIDSSLRDADWWSQELARVLTPKDAADVQREVGSVVTESKLAVKEARRCLERPLALSL